MKCKHCGAEIPNGKTKCPYCNSEVDIPRSNESGTVCPRCGSGNIKFTRESSGSKRTYISQSGILFKRTKTGRSRQTTEHHTVGLCQNCGYSWEPSFSNSGASSHGVLWWFVVIMFFPIAAAIYIIKNYDKQPRGFWWWVSAVLAFPVTISLWIYKTEKFKLNKWLRILIIVVFWIILLFVAPSGEKEQREKAGAAETEATTEQTTESPAETTAVETTAETTAATTQAETTTAAETTVAKTEPETTAAVETTAEETTAQTQPETTVAPTTAPATQAETTVAETQAETTAAETQPVIVVETQPETTAAAQDPGNSSAGITGQLYATKSGECYHYIESCAQNAKPITLEEAQRRHLRPCEKCAR